MTADEHTIFDSTVRYAVTRYIVDHGFAPTVEVLAQQLDTSGDTVTASFQRLSESHGLVLHPNSNDIWVAHSFSLAPTPFWVTSARGSWWGNCGWCSLGIAAMLQDDAQITTRLGAQNEVLDIRIENGVVSPADIVLHLAVPAARWWDNVIYTCGTILFFRSEDAVDAWCRDRNIDRGAVLTMDQAWNLAQAWYGDYLRPSWQRRTTAEAQAAFHRLGLTGPFWQLDPDWH
ncbi:MAG: alkylmercury lyase family protein [Rhodothermales bacterium]